MKAKNNELKPLPVAILTVSDSRTLSEDSSGDYLQEAVLTAGHQLGARALMPSNRLPLLVQLATWLLLPELAVIIINGGTGYGERDHTADVLKALLEQEIIGFGELFRSLSYADVGSSAMQSRALAGFANGKAVFALPGSPSACRLGWQALIAPQLDARTRPCNLVAQLQGLHCSMRS